MGLIVPLSPHAISIFALAAVSNARTGRRYYSPELGRWVNRDPIGERGGRNLHVFVENHAVYGVDLLGHSVFSLKDRCSVNIVIGHGSDLRKFFRIDDRQFIKKWRRERQATFIFGRTKRVATDTYLIPIACSIGAESDNIADDFRNAGYPVPKWIGDVPYNFYDPGDSSTGIGMVAYAVAERWSDDPEGTLGWGRPPENFPLNETERPPSQEEWDAYPVSKKASVNLRITTKRAIIWTRFLAGTVDPKTTACKCFRIRISVIEVDKKVRKTNVPDFLNQAGLPPFWFEADEKSGEHEFPIPGTEDAGE